MIFTKKIVLVTAVAFALIQSGCGWINQPPKAQKAFQMADLSCLDHVSDQMQDLFEGKYTDSLSDQEKINGIWTCLDKALDSFAKNTRGGKPGIYQSTELMNFGNHYLSKDHILHPSFINAIFNLKVSFLGGDNTSISIDEINKLRKTIEAFSKIVLPLSSKISILLDPKNASYAQKLAASEQLNSFMVGMSGILESTSQPLQWAELNSFILELQHYTHSQSTATLNSIRELLPLFQYFKLLLVGGSENNIEMGKWKSLLLGFSSFYKSFNTSTQTSEILNGIRLEVLSNSAEQKIAVTQISSILISLKNDPHLRTHDMSDILADLWAKTLLGNSLLFPSTQGGLAVNALFGSPSIRKLAGEIADEIAALSSPANPESIIQISKLLQSLIRKASEESKQFRSPEGISIASLKEYSQSLTLLMHDPAEFKLVISSIDLLANAKAILIGSGADQISATDLSALVSKATSIYLSWSDSRNSVMESLGFSIDELLLSPSPKSISAALVLDSLQKAKDFCVQAKIETNVPWENISLYIKNGFSIKGLMMGSSAQALHYDETKTLLDLIKPFRTKDSLGSQLNKLSKLLGANPFNDTKISVLLDYLNPILVAAKVENLPFSISEKNIGLAKALFLGGSKTIIEAGDYALLARGAGSFLTALSDKIAALPDGFSPGLDTRSMELAETAIKTLIEFQNGVNKAKPASFEGIDLTLVKELALLAGPSLGITFDPKHLDETLIGFSFRVLQNQKGPKPTTLAGVITPRQLEIFEGLIHKFIYHLKDLERAYASVDHDTQPLEKAVLIDELTDPVLLYILNLYRPQLMGPKHILMQPKLGEVFSKYYYFDLAFKALVHEGLLIVFPAYKIKKDPGATDRVRLGMSDLTDLLTDFNNILTDFEMSFGYEAPEVTAEKRMITFNVFTQSGNGDPYLDFDETVEFLTMTLGGQVLFNHARKTIIEKCFPNEDWRKIKNIPGSCFVPLYFEPKFYQSLYGESLPQMSETVASLSPKELESFKIGTLLTVKAGLSETSNFALEDLQAVTLFPEYIENLFIRLDANRDGIMQFSESMSGFPLFCNQIYQGAAGKISGSCDPFKDPGKLKAIYGFMIMKGTAPRGIKPGDSLLMKIRQGLSMLKWFKTWDKLPKDPAIRDVRPPLLARKNLLSILANLALSAPIESSQLNEPNQPLSTASSASRLVVDERPGLR